MDNVHNGGIPPLDRSNMRNALNIGTGYHVGTGTKQTGRLVRSLAWRVEPQVRLTAAAPQLSIIL